MNLKKPIRAENVSKTLKKSLYPEPFASLMKGRSKRKLGDHFDLLNFGVNLTELSPGAMSALKHMHSKQDEFIYILSGTPTLVCGCEEYVLESGECYGFKSGSGIAHHLGLPITHKITLDNQRQLLHASKHENTKPNQTHIISTNQHRIHQTIAER